MDLTSNEKEREGFDQSTLVTSPTPSSSESLGETGKDEVDSHRIIILEEGLEHNLRTEVITPTTTEPTLGAKDGDLELKLDEFAEPVAKNVEEDLIENESSIPPVAIQNIVSNPTFSSILASGDAEAVFAYLQTALAAYDSGILSAGNEEVESGKIDVVDGVEFENSNLGEEVKLSALAANEVQFEEENQSETVSHNQSTLDVNDFDVSIPAENDDVITVEDILLTPVPPEIISNGINQILTPVKVGNISPSVQETEFVFEVKHESSTPNTDSFISATSYESLEADLIDFFPSENPVVVAARGEASASTKIEPLPPVENETLGSSLVQVVSPAKENAAALVETEKEFITPIIVITPAENEIETAFTTPVEADNGISAKREVEDSNLNSLQPEDDANVKDEPATIKVEKEENNVNKSSNVDGYTPKIIHKSLEEMWAQVPKHGETNVLNVFANHARSSESNARKGKGNGSKRVTFESSNDGDNYTNDKTLRGRAVPASGTGPGTSRRGDNGSGGDIVGQKNTKNRESEGRGHGPRGFGQYQSQNRNQNHGPLDKDGRSTKTVHFGGVDRTVVCPSIQEITSMLDKNLQPRNSRGNQTAAAILTTLKTVFSENDRYQYRKYVCTHPNCRRAGKEWIMVSLGSAKECHSCHNWVEPWTDPRLESVSPFERLIGHFRCPFRVCRREWVSGLSYKHRGQKCADCTTLVYPYSLTVPGSPDRGHVAQAQANVHPAQ